MLGQFKDGNRIENTTHTHWPCLQNNQNKGQVLHMSLLSFFFFFLIFIWLQQAGYSTFIVEHGSRVAACGTQFPDQGSIPGPLPWEHDGVPVTGPLVRS